MKKKSIITILKFILFANILATIVFASYDFNVDLYKEDQNDPIWILYILANFGGLLVGWFHDELNKSQGFFSDLFK